MVEHPKVVSDSSISILVIGIVVVVGERASFALPFMVVVVPYLFVLVVAVDADGWVVDLGWFVVPVVVGHSRSFIAMYSYSIRCEPSVYTYTRSPLRLRSIF